MPKIKPSLIALALLLPLSATAGKKQYAMEDLKALAKDSRWSELLAHIEDIKPSQRNDAWKRLLRRAAKGWLARPRIAANPLEASSIAEALLRAHPGLAKDKALMARRDKVGLEAFTRCFARRYWATRCEQHLRGFIAQKGTAGATAHAAGKLVLRNMRHHLAAFYFRHAVSGPHLGNKKQVAKRCADRELKNSVLAAVARPSKDPSVAHAKAVGFGPCWPQLKKELVQTVALGEQTRKNLCKELLHRKVLTSVRMKKCSRLLARQR